MCCLIFKGRCRTLPRYMWTTSCKINCNVFLLSNGTVLYLIYKTYFLFCNEQAYERDAVSAHTLRLSSVAKPAGKHLHLHALAAYCHGAQGELGWLNTDESLIRFTSSTEPKRFYFTCRFEIHKLYRNKGT